MDIQEFNDRYDVVGTLGKVGIAIAILIITWIVAKVVANIFAKLVNKVPALQKAGADGQSLGKSLGSIASLLVWLFGLMAVLQLFGLTQVLAPVQNMLNGVFAFLPNIIGAGLVFVVGAIIAKIVRQLVETALGAVPFDKWLGKGKSSLENATGVGEVPGSAPAHAATVPGHSAPSAEGGLSARSIVKMIGLVLYSMIMLVVAISALQILDIEAISEPATDMLQKIMDAIPNVIAGAVLLAIGVLIAGFVTTLLAELLGGLGIDRALHNMEVLPAGKSAIPTITKIVQIAIVLVFAVAATKLLGFPEITAFLEEILELGGKVAFGGAIIAAGFVVANVLAKVVGGSAANIVRIATLVLFGAMGLKYMGLADSIINLAFGALVVGGAAAAALAFGLGGREAAARQLAKMQNQNSGPQV
ncbi:mechanosensitive ion channel [Nocardioides sp.]|uniref:mechanosensitive ion channel n=1 Tax=Nocardioides sp. TaxID=35761 RepID=UPI002CC489AA|nr:mechanosensitive ion channel [Nocardioides sp.]HSX68509.1 mechanosensitive ion channel [Nocardioides sp.]